MPWGSKELELVRQQIAGLQKLIAQTREEVRTADESAAAQNRLLDAKANLKRLKAGA